MAARFMMNALHSKHPGLRIKLLFSGEIAPVSPVTARFMMNALHNKHPGLRIKLLFSGEIAPVSPMAARFMMNALHNKHPGLRIKLLLQIGSSKLIIHPKINKFKVEKYGFQRRHFVSYRKCV